MKNSPNDNKLLVELAIVLVIKVIILIIIWHCFFDEESQPATPPIAEKLFSSNTDQGDTF